MRLEEYWEVEGRMLCEWHMPRAIGEQSPESRRGTSGGEADARATKRVTRYIDLAGLGLGGSELR